MKKIKFHNPIKRTLYLDRKFYYLSRFYFDINNKNDMIIIKKSIINKIMIDTFSVATPLFNKVLRISS